VSKAKRDKSVEKSASTVESTDANVWGSSSQAAEQADAAAEKPKKMDKRLYETELKKLHVELVRLQEWIKHNGLRVVVLFEGRDAAGKGGTIKRITECLSPRVSTGRRPTTHVI
jgi:polyphosphate kinase 2 (PPK2 family)